MKLKILLEEMENAMDRYDLSDDFLEARGCGTRTIGEFQYGVSSVPCDWVYPYLKALSEDERLSDVIDEIEEQMRGEQDD